MEKAIAYLFGHKIVGTVKLTDVGDCVFYEIDIKNLFTSELELMINDVTKIIDFSYIPLLHNGRIRLCFYSDVLFFDNMLGQKLLLKNPSSGIIATGNVIKVWQGRKYYTEIT